MDMDSLLPINSPPALGTAAPPAHDDAHDDAQKDVPETAEELSLGSFHLNAETVEVKIEPGSDLLKEIEDIPDKMAFKIGEAAEMVGVKQYVLRYWESEFDMLKPRKSKNNQRVYSRRDVETAMMIKKLLYSDRFSIEGARSAIRHLRSQVKQDRNIKAIVQNQETAVSTAVNRLRSLVIDIRRIRDIFA